MAKKPEGEIKLIPTKAILHDPVAFGFLMEFQYGSGQASQDAASALFGGLDGILVNDLEEMGIAVSDLQFWTDLQRQTNAQEPADYRLYANAGLESRLAARYLADAGLAFEVCQVRSAKVPIDIDRYIPVPVLVAPSGCFAPFCAVKNYVRRYLLSQTEEKNRAPSFEGHWDSIPTEKNRAVCHDATGRMIYSGPVASASKLAAFTRTYPEHRSIVSWAAGEWNDLLEGRKNHTLKAPATRTLLFPDEIAQLAKGGWAVLSCEDPNHRGIEVCFRQEGCLYRVYAEK